MITDLHVKHKTTKLPEDNMGEKLDDCGFGKSFLDTIPKVQSMKEIGDKLDFYELNISTLQKTVSRQLKEKHRLRDYICKRHIQNI